VSGRVLTSLNFDEQRDTAQPTHDFSQSTSRLACPRPVSLPGGHLLTALPLPPLSRTEAVFNDEGNVRQETAGAELVPQARRAPAPRSVCPRVAEAAVIGAGKP
jgi:hypothetical protein